jgi:hypothetical protein
MPHSVNSFRNNRVAAVIGATNRGTLLLLTTLLAGCQFSENRYLDRSVQAEELVGAWRATELSIEAMKDVGLHDHLAVHDHTFVLRPDGSCALRTVMNSSSGDAMKYAIYDTGCRWKLGNIGHQALQFDLTPAPVGGAPYYYFDEDDGRLVLWQYFTDPDAWRYVEFEKAG